MSTTNPTNYAAAFLITNFVFNSFASSRLLKSYCGIDHNSAPRQDIATYGERAVAEGKLSRSMLDTIRRMEAAHENGVAHFPFFASAMLFALHARLPSEFINKMGAAYTGARIVYTVAYIFISSEKLSVMRTAAWWTSNIICIYTLVQCGKAIN